MKADLVIALYVLSAAFSYLQQFIMAGVSLYFGFTSSGVDNGAHVGGMISGFILAVLLYHPGHTKPYKIREITE